MLTSAQFSLISAGVIFSIDTETGFPDSVLITAAWGLGETVVQGRVRPDEFWVHKPTLRQGYRPIVRREIAEKALKLLVQGDRNWSGQSTLFEAVRQRRHDARDLVDGRCGA